PVAITIASRFVYVFKRYNLLVIKTPTVVEPTKDVIISTILLPGTLKTGLTTGSNIVPTKSIPTKLTKNGMKNAPTIIMNATPTTTGGMTVSHIRISHSGVYKPLNVAYKTYHIIKKEPIEYIIR